VNHLLRPLAPVTERVWSLIDEEATGHLLPALGARRLVDFSGPHGWRHSATSLGRTTGLASGPAEGVTIAQRRVLPLIELRAAFHVARAELADIERGAVDVRLDSLDQAALAIALAENSAIFTGVEPAEMIGITDGSPHKPIPLGGESAGYPAQVAKAAEVLLRAGIAGPYGIALAPAVYTSVVETTEHGGYPVFEHLTHILGGPIVRVPGVAGAVVLSLRGGDFLYESGQDISVGYERSDETDVHFYLEESFSFRVATPEAAIALPPANHA
jgi:uncharacterized linocin/CFP29 family protein